MISEMAVGALEAHAFSPDALRVVERPVAARPGRGEILVRVRVARIVVTL